MTITELSSVKYAWQLAALAKMQAYEATHSNAAVKALLFTAEKSLAVEADFIATLAAAMKIINPAAVEDGWREFAFLGFDGRVRLGKLIDDLVV